VPRGIRYTDEQKAKMRELALKLKGEGKSQNAIAKAVGVTIPTLKKLIGAAAKPREKTQAAVRAGRRRVAPKQAHPAFLLAEKQARLEEIEQETTSLAKEAAALKQEIRALYKALGEKLGQAASRRKPRKRTRKAQKK